MLAHDACSRLACGTRVAGGAPWQGTSKALWLGSPQTSLSSRDGILGRPCDRGQRKLFVNAVRIQTGSLAARFSAFLYSRWWLDLTAMRYAFPNPSARALLSDLGDGVRPEQKLGAPQPDPKVGGGGETATASTTATQNARNAGRCRRSARPSARTATREDTPRCEIEPMFHEDVGHGTRWTWGQRRKNQATRTRRSAHRPARSARERHGKRNPRPASSRREATQSRARLDRQGRAQRKVPVDILTSGPE